MCIWVVVATVGGLLTTVALYLVYGAFVALPAAAPAVTRARADQIAIALLLLKQETGRYPKATAWPSALTMGTPTRGAILNAEGATNLTDGWGRALRYTPTGTGFTLASAGPDGRFNTADDIVVKR